MARYAVPGAIGGTAGFLAVSLLPLNVIKPLESLIPIGTRLLILHRAHHAY